MTLKIDIWSDVVCPFCYLGTRKLELAIEKLAITPKIVWHSFELNPNAPPKANLVTYLSDKFGASQQDVERLLTRQESDFEKLGLVYNWRECKPGNTFNAHRLIHLAQTKGLGTKAENTFFKGYFSDGKAIAEPAVLKELGLQVGLSAEEIDDVLGSSKFTNEVRQDEARAHALGIEGVPYFVVNDTVVVSGAQDVATFVDVLGMQDNSTASSDGACKK